jgi:hypothetical protein
LYIQTVGINNGFLWDFYEYRVPQSQMTHAVKSPKSKYNIVFYSKHMFILPYNLTNSAWQNFP